MGMVDDGIWMMTDGYDPDVNAALKSELPGPARWVKNQGRWVFPLHWDTCTGARRVATKFGADIKIARNLVEWAEAEKARRATIPDVQSMDLVELPAVKAASPAIWKALESRPFQTVGAAFAARNQSCLIADQPGLGKTIQSYRVIGYSVPWQGGLPLGSAKLVAAGHVSFVLEVGW
jgi:hypothetical protein